MSDTGVHWPTRASANFWIILHAGGVASIDAIRLEMRPQSNEADANQKAWSLVSSSQEVDVLLGLHTLTDHVLDWASLGRILGHLLENMYTGEHTIHQVMEVMSVIVDKIASGEFTLPSNVKQDFDRDPTNMADLVATFRTIMDGESEESLEHFQERVDDWLMGYGTP